MLNTMVEGFFEGGESSYAWRRYTCQILNIEDLPNTEGEGKMKVPEATISFS